MARPPPPPAKADGSRAKRRAASGICCGRETMRSWSASATALADDPELTCRLPGLEDRSPLRVVLDTRLRLSEWSKLAQTASDTPTLVFTTTDGRRGAARLRRARSSRWRAMPGPARCRSRAGGTWRARSDAAAGRGRGARSTRPFWTAAWPTGWRFSRAPIILGEAGHGGIEALAAYTLGEAPRLRRIARRRFGPDLLESFAREGLERTMFTGIVSDIGQVRHVEKRGDTNVVIATHYDVAAMRCRRFGRLRRRLHDRRRQGQRQGPLVRRHRLWRNAVEDHHRAWKVGDRRSTSSGRCA